MRCIQKDGQPGHPQHDFSGGHDRLKANLYYDNTKKVLHLLKVVL